MVKKIKIFLVLFIICGIMVTNIGNKVSAKNRILSYGADLWWDYSYPAYESEEISMDLNGDKKFETVSISLKGMKPYNRNPEEEGYHFSPEWKGKSYVTININDEKCYKLKLNKAEKMANSYPQFDILQFSNNRRLVLLYFCDYDDVNVGNYIFKYHGRKLKKLIRLGGGGIIKVTKDGFVSDQGIIKMLSKTDKYGHNCIKKYKKYKYSKGKLKLVKTYKKKSFTC